MIYIKSLFLDIIEMCFTFRSAGHSADTSLLSGLGLDIGLTIASLESAKIKLSPLKLQNYFGNISEILARVTKHYSRQTYL